MMTQQTNNTSESKDTNQRLLSADDGSAFEMINGEGTSNVVLICEHASNKIPTRLKNLGLTNEILNTHIAWDLGAHGLATQLSATLDAPLIAAGFSRLVYDCNRPPESRTAMPSQTEQGKIPGNTSLSQLDKLTRVEEIYTPFHAAVTHKLNQKKCRALKPVVISIHSFTPVFNGKQRSVQVGYLHGQNAQLAETMLVNSSPDNIFDIRLNEPYAPKDGVLHTLELHASLGTTPHIMIEVRNDLLSDEKSRQNVHDMLINSLTISLRETGNTNFGYTQ